MASLRYVCSNCGSGAVLKQATAIWDIATCQWVLGEVYDKAMCLNCCDRCKLIWILTQPAVFKPAEQEQANG